MNSPALQHLNSMVPPHTSIWCTTSYQYDLGLSCLGGECTAENFIGHCWAGGGGGEGGFGKVGEGCGEHVAYYILAVLSISIVVMPMRVINAMSDQGSVASSAASAEASCQRFQLVEVPILSSNFEY